MVAIFTGLGLGLERGSLSLLGGRGGVGASGLGRANENVSVNASTGNLVINRTDEMLFGVGEDVEISRVYNSQGLSTDDNGDNWRPSIARSVSALSGTVNTAGSTIKRVDWDGSEVVYSWNGAAYVSKEGAGAYDSLSFSSVDNTWTWTDGGTQVQEVYDNTSGGRITARKDADGNTISYSYTGSLLTRVTTANGEYTNLSYIGTQLTQLATYRHIAVNGSDSLSLYTRVRYGYDASNRLSTVTVDLSPADNSIVNGATYLTSYTYDGTSKRVASISQSDGSRLAIAYDTSFRVASLTQSVSSGVTRTTSFSYDTVNRVTTVTDPLSQVTKLTYDASGQLTRLELPPAATGASAQVTQFTYNANGDVLTVTEPGGQVTTYGYDASGNRILERDVLGNTVTRRFGSKNELLAEIRYVTPDPDGGGPAAASNPLISRYVYDAENHLVFQISAEGRVRQFGYDAAGNQTSIATFAGSTYDVSALSPTTDISKAIMEAWVMSGIDLTTVQRIDSTYDFRGNPSTVTSYGKSTSYGTGDVTGEVSQTVYVYDQAGILLTRKSVKTFKAGTSMAATTNDETFVSDGLGRLVSSVDLYGGTTSVLFDDANSRTIVTQANGQTETTTYNLAGELVSLQRGGGQTAAAQVFRYDGLGRLRIGTDETGLSTHSLYDAVSRKVAEIGSDGSMVEYAYDANDRVISTVAYDTRLSAAQLALLTDANGNPLSPSLASLRPASAANLDRHEWRIYDNAGRLVQTIDGSGAVTGYVYDGASRLIGTTQYGTRLSATTISGYKASVPTTAVSVAPVNYDRVTRNLYDLDGRLAATLDGQGYLTRFIYDKAGQRIETVRFATAVASAVRASGTLAQLVASAGVNASDIHEYEIYDRRGLLSASIDGEGNLTRYHYDALGQQDSVTRGQVVTANTSYTLASLPAPGSAVLDVTTYVRNAAGQVLTETKALAGGVNDVTTYTYNSMGEVLTVTTSSVAGVGTGAKTTYEYDGRGRLSRALTGRGSQALISPPINPLTGVAMTAADVWAAYGTSYQYDDEDRIISKTEPSGSAAAGSRTLYFYDSRGQLAFEVDPAGSVTEYRYNAFGERTDLIKHSVAIGSALLGGLQGGDSASVTSYVMADATDSRFQTAYNVTGNISARTDAEGNVTTFDYNVFNQVWLRKDSLVGDTTVNTEYTYDMRGYQWTEKRDAAGVQATTTTFYDAFGRNLLVTDPLGQSSSTSYDRAGRVVTQTDALNKVVSYTYDGRGNIITIKDRANQSSSAVTTFSHTAFNRTVTVTTPQSLTTVTRYDGQGHATSITAPGGAITTYAYDRDGNLQSVTDSLGRITTNTWDSAGRLADVINADGSTTHFTFDAVGRILTQTTDFGQGKLNLVTTYAYDAKGQRIRVTDPSGVATKLEFDRNGKTTKVILDEGSGKLNLTTLYEYDKAGRSVRMTEAAGTSAATTTQYDYDALDRLTKKTVDFGEGRLNLLTQYTYDKNGNVVQTTDAAGGVWRYKYDANNRLTYTANPVGGVQRTIYDANDKIIESHAFISLISANAQLDSVMSSGMDEVTRNVYDKDGRLRYSINAANLVTQYSYDAYGNVTRQIQYGVNYDNSVANPTESDMITWASASAVANSALTRVARAVFDAAGQQIYSIDALGYVTKSSFDQMGRVTKQIRYATAYGQADIQSLATMDAWAAGSAIANDVNNRTDRNFYDAAGRVSFLFDAESYFTEYQYDAAGRTTKSVRYGERYVVTDGTTTANVKAAVGATPPVTAVVTRFEYDTAGRLKTTTDGMGARTELTLDALGRTTRLKEAAGTGDEAITDRDYDGAGRIEREVKGVGMPFPAETLYSYNGVGQVTLVSDPRGYVSRNCYDAAGRLRTSVRPISETEWATTSNDYDAFGNLVKVTDPNGNAGYFYYDTLNRLVAQVDPEGYLTKTEYHALSNEAISVTRYANKLQNLASIAAGAPPVVVANQSNVGSQVALVANSARDATTYYARDKLDRLTGIQDAMAATESYGLNAFGDRSSVTNKIGGTTTYTYDKRGLALTEVLPVNSVLQNATTILATSITNRFEYDARGNRIKTVEAVGLPEQRTTKFEYDKLDRVKEKIGDAVLTRRGSDMAWTGTVIPTETIVYDLRGNVVATTDPGGARTLYYYDDLNRKIAQVDPVGALQTWRHDANGNAVAAISWATPLNNAALAVGGAAPLPADAIGRETRFEYDRNNRLIRTEIINVRTGTWTGSSFETSITNINTRIKYDAAGNIIKQTDGRGGEIETGYDKLGRRKWQKDQAGYVTEWDYDAEGNVEREIRHGGADPQRITQFTYDKNGRRLTETRKAVAVMDVASNAAFATATADIAIVYTYNGLGLVTSKREGNGDLFQYQYDAGGRLFIERGPDYVDYLGNTVGNMTAYHYNGLNQITRTTEGDVGNWTASNTSVHTMAYYYGAGGRLAKTQDSQDFYKEYSYDAAGHVVAEEFTRTMSDVAFWGGPTEYARDANVYTYDAAGRVTGQATLRLIQNVWKSQWSATNNSTGNNGVAWSNTTYNAYGDVIGRGTNGVQAETMEYDSAGRLWRSNAGDGVTRVYVHDAAGNVTMTIQSRGKQVEDADPAEIDLTAYSQDEIIDKFKSGGVVGGHFVNKLIATYSLYDARNLLQGTVETFRELNEAQQQGLAARQTLTTAKNYNAFGEVASETDALQRVTTYTYNTMGRLIKTAQVGAPGYGYQSFYDRSGRLTATADPLGRLTMRTLLAGSGYDGEEAKALKEFYPGGGFVTLQYDVYGNMRKRTDEIGRVQTFVYDKENRLTAQTNWVGTSQEMTDYYKVDELGRRIAHWNSFTGSGVQEWTDYDEYGRVARLKDFGGNFTTYHYAFGPTLGGIHPFSTHGYYTKTTTNSAGLTSLEHTDTFGHLLGTNAINGDRHNFIFNNAGQVIGDTYLNVDESISYNNRNFTYFNTGRLSAVRDAHANGQQAYQSTYSRYDAVGNKVSETQVETVTDAAGAAILDAYGHVQNTVTQQTTTTYDALDRVDSVTDAATGARATYTYDYKGNVLSSVASFIDPVSGAFSSQSITYDYDVMDRLVAKTTNNNGVYTGTTMLYNAAGQRMQSNTDGGVEVYTYDGAGYLIKTVSSFGTTGQVTFINRDKLGRMTGYEEWQGGALTYKRHSMVYDARSQQLASEMTYLKRSDGSVVQTYSVTYYTQTSIDPSLNFSVGGGYLAGAVGGNWTSSHIYTASQWSGRSQNVTLWENSGSFEFRDEKTANALVWGDGAAKQVGAATVLHVSNVIAPTGYNANYTFESNGNLKHVDIIDGQTRSVDFVTDFRGQVLSRTETHSSGVQRDRSYYFDGLKWGATSNDGTADEATTFAISINRRQTAASGPYSLFNNGGPSSGADFDQSYEPINPTTTSTTGGSYSVQIGDTLQSVALAVWGDAGLWYLIAEANNLTGAVQLIAGQTLAIPNKVHNLHNTSGTFKPYDPNLAQGDLDPAQAPQPKPKKNNDCGGFGQILLVVIAVAVTIVTAGATIAALAPTSASITGVFGASGGVASFLGGGAALTTGSTGIGLGTMVAAGAIGGAAGSIVSQGVGVATGIQDKFSWKGVAMSALAGGVTAGLGRLGGSTVSGAMLRGAAGNAVTQGIAVATGLQERFDWAGVAVGGIVGGVGAKVGALASGRGIDGWRADALSGLAGGVVGAGARSLLTGTSFGDNLRAVLPDAIGTTIGNAIAGGLSARSSGKSGAGNGLTSSQGSPDGNGYVTGDPASALMRSMQAAMPEIKLDLGLDLNLQSPLLISGSAQGGSLLSAQTQGSLARADRTPSITEADWNDGGHSYTTAFGENIHFGGLPSVTVNGITTVDEVTITASRRGALGWLAEAGSDLLHGRFSEIGTDLSGAGRSLSRTFMATDAAQHYGQAFGMPYTFQAGNGVKSVADLQQRQSGFRTYLDKEVTPTLNRQLALGGGAIILAGVTGGVGLAALGGTSALGGLATITTGKLVSGAGGAISGAISGYHDTGTLSGTLLGAGVGGGLGFALAPVPGAAAGLVPLTSGFAGATRLGLVLGTNGAVSALSGLASTSAEHLMFGGDAPTLSEVTGNLRRDFAVGAATSLLEAPFVALRVGSSLSQPVMDYLGAHTAIYGALASLVTSPPSEAPKPTTLKPRP